MAKTLIPYPCHRCGLIDTLGIVGHPSRCGVPPKVWGSQQRRKDAADRMAKLNEDPEFKARKLAGHQAHYKALGGPKGYRDKEKRKLYNRNWMRKSREARDGR